MRKLTVKIWLTIAAFFLSATVSVADCSSNANQCTPKQLCSAATSTEGGVKVWSKSSYYSKHVSKAKQVGINCGVVEIVASCDNDPELCSVDDLCKQSVQKSGGKTGWKTSSRAAGHIALAKEFGLKCGVTQKVAKKTCFEDVRFCNPLYLCSKAVVKPYGQTKWKTASYFEKYITEARRRGLTCGVTETVAEKKTCAEDVSECNASELCNRSTYTKGTKGTKAWKVAGKHATEAKRQGLSCGVNETVSKKKTCSQDVRECNASELCNRSTYTKGTKAWKVAGKHVTEAKRRGLSCGVTEKSCSDDMSYCSQSHVCRAATKIVNGKKVWDWNWSTSGKRNFAGEAKHRGLTCGVKGGNNTQTASNTSSYTNTTILKNAFRGESVLKRKQLQYALKKLNYYTSSIDALYGPGTERALTGYANAKGLNGRSPNSIFSSVLSQVSVPSSFAVAKRSNNSSSSSSSSSSGGSSAGKTLLQGLFVAGACSLTSNPGACLDGATGNNRSSNTGSSSPKTLSSGTWIKSGNTYIGPGGEAVFDNGRVIQGTDGSLCHRTRNAIICQ